MQDKQKPDFAQGFSMLDLFDHQPVPGKVGEEDIILVRDGWDIFAVSAFCTHYHGALEDGLVLGDSIRCPLHHACFSLRTGEAVRAPAFDPIDCWRIEQVGTTVYVKEKLPRLEKNLIPVCSPSSIVVVGGGAAGFAAAEMLRREGFKGKLTIISADDSVPYDRPNLSKDFLAGNAPADWIALKGSDFYRTLNIDLVLNAPVASINTESKTVVLKNGTSYTWEALLLATGADPVRLTVPGLDNSRMFYLRTFEDSKKISEKCATAKRVIVIGSSFIGLEATASLRSKNVEVHIVSNDEVPLKRIMGDEIGVFVRQLHESHGVKFHLGTALSRASGSTVTLTDGTAIEDVDFIVVGAGVTPSLELAIEAGLSVDHGVLVDRYLETNVPGIYAAGDIARWPHPNSGQPIRIEHWVVAERQGQVAARNMLGKQEAFTAVPFFWTQQYDVTINYVGYAEHWDTIAIDGKPTEKNCQIDYILEGRILASATIGRNYSSLEAEMWQERNISEGKPRPGEN